MADGACRARCPPQPAASPPQPCRASAAHLRASPRISVRLAQVWLEPVPTAYISALEISPSVEARANGATNGTLRAQVTVRLAACGGGAGRAAALAAALRGGAIAQLRLSAPEPTSARSGGVDGGVGGGVGGGIGGGVGGAAGRWGMAPVRPDDQQAECSPHAGQGVGAGVEAASALRWSCEATLTVGDVSRWSPETPHLYRLSVALSRGGGGGGGGSSALLDEVSSYSAFRSVALVPGHAGAPARLHLNGAPC
jgi:hypothetical protein